MGNVYCKRHQCYHKKFPKYASCIEDKTKIKETSLLNKDNHTLGCDLESYAQTIRFRGYDKEANDLDEIASRIK